MARLPAPCRAVAADPVKKEKIIMTTIDWCKSRRSISNGACVEVGVSWAALADRCGR